MYMPDKKVKKFNPFSKISTRELVGLEFDNDILKIAHLKVSLHKVELVNVLSRVISGLNEGNIAKILKGIIADLKVNNPTIIDIVTSPSVITKNIEIPSIDAQEIKEIIVFEIFLMNI